MVFSNFIQSQAPLPMATLQKKDPYPPHWPNHRNVELIPVQKDAEIKIKGMFENTFNKQNADTISSIMEVCNKKAFDRFLS